MSRFLFTTMPATGHVTPKLPIARELVTRGHDVHWYTGAVYRSVVEETGAVHHPIRSAEDFGGQTVDEAFPELRGLTGVRMVRHAFERVFIDNAPGMFPDCRTIHVEHAIDAVLAEPLCLAARWLHECSGLAWATLGETVLALYSRDTAATGLGLPPLGGLPGAARNGLLNAAHRRIVFAGVTRHYERARATAGLAPLGRSFIDALPSPYMYLQATVPAFEYPRRDLPQQVHFIGPLLPEPDPAPRPWPQDGRPVALVTQGTVATNPEALLVPAVRALAGGDWHVLVTTGAACGPARTARNTARTRSPGRTVRPIRASARPRRCTDHQRRLRNDPAGTRPRGADRGRGRHRGQARGRRSRRLVGCRNTDRLRATPSAGSNGGGEPRAARSALPRARACDRARDAWPPRPRTAADLLERLVLGNDLLTRTSPQTEVTR